MMEDIEKLKVIDEITQEREIKMIGVVMVY